MNENSDILIIGIGNEWIGDDAFGIYAVKKLQKQHPDLGRFQLISGDLSRLLTLWENKKVIIIDAACSTTKPAGHVYESDSYHNMVSYDNVFYSSHSFGLEEILQMASAIGRLPPSLKLIGVEGSNWQKGHPISKEVKKAYDTVEKIVLNYLTELPISSTSK